MRSSRNPGATQRAAAALISNPGRSDRLIALTAGCEHRTVGRTRKRLEAAGMIPAVTQRTPRFPLGPREPGATQQALNRLGPYATTRQVMDAAGVDRSAVWWARQHRRLIPHDAAAATEAFSVAKSTPAMRRWNFARPSQAQMRPRPCMPTLPGTAGRGSIASYQIGWERDSDAARRLCLNWCTHLASCREFALNCPDHPAKILGGLDQSERQDGLTEPRK